MCAEKTERTGDNRAVELAASQYQAEESKQPQAEAENLKLEDMLLASPGKISILFLVFGVLSLVLSVISNSQVLAFIGLGLTFWGALFLLIRPVRYVEGALLDSDVLSTYKTIDRMINDLKPKGKSYYIPPYPEDVYVPEHLKGLKDIVVFIAADAGSTIPSIEEMAKGKFMLENPKGICISPPGAGLLARFEKELRRDITKVELGELCESISQLATEKLQLAKEIEMKPEEKGVHVKILDSMYKDLYRQESLKSVHLLGCPLVSAMACAIAKATGKAVTLHKITLSPDEQTIEAWFRTIQG